MTGALMRWRRRSLAGYAHRKPCDLVHQSGRHDAIGGAEHVRVPADRVSGIRTLCAEYLLKSLGEALGLLAGHEQHGTGRVVLHSKKGRQSQAEKLAGRIVACLEYVRTSVGDAPAPVN